MLSQWLSVFLKLLPTLWEKVVSIYSVTNNLLFHWMSFSVHLCQHYFCICHILKMTKLLKTQILQILQKQNVKVSLLSFPTFASRMLKIWYVISSLLRKCTWEEMLCIPIFNMEGTEYLHAVCCLHYALFTSYNLGTTVLSQYL